MATVHDKYVVELAEVIKGYGNHPDVNDPFCLSEFYRFYEIPNVCVSAENFKKMRPLSDFTMVKNMETIEPRPRGRWLYLSDSDGEHYCCSQCGEELPRYSLNTPTWDDPYTYLRSIDKSNFCPNCGADMREVQSETD